MKEQRDAKIFKAMAKTRNFVHELDNAISDRKVPKVAVAGYGFGMLAQGIAAGLFGSTLFKFWTDPNWMGVPEAFYLFVMTIFAIWNAFNDPLAGMLIDKTKTRFGRYIPYIGIGGPIVGILFIFLWIPPPGMSMAQLSLYLFIIIMVYDTVYTIVVIARCSILTHISLDHRERSRINFVATIFSTVGVVIAFLVPNLLLINPSPWNQVVFRNMMILLGIIISVSFLFMAIAVNKRLGDEVPPCTTSIKETFGSIIRNPNFICFIIYDFCHVLTLHILSANLPNYIEFVFRNNSLYLLVFFISAILGLLAGMRFMNYLSKNFAVRNVLIYATASYAFGGLLIWLGDTIFIQCLGAFFFGNGVLGPLIYIDPFMSDIIDEDEIRTGENRAANYNGTAALFSKNGHLVADIIALRILVPATYQMPNEFRDFGLLAEASKWVIGFVPFIAMFIAFWAIFFIPLKGDKYIQMKTALLEKKLKNGKKEDCKP